MKPPRINTGARVLAAAAAVGIVIVTAACSGSGPKAAQASPPASGTASSSASAASAASASGPGLGLYDGKFGPKGIETAAKWLGSAGSITYAQDFIDATSWSSISSPWNLANWKNSPYTMIWGVPMLPCGVSGTECSTKVADYNQVADGGADSYYKTLAKNLVKAGFGSSYIRLGWEFNGTVMGWSTCNQQGSGATSWAKDFVPAYQNIVTSMRSVAGASFKFIWNPLEGSNVSCDGVHLESYYPGDKYVDVVAMDVYDGLGQTVSSDAARWSDMLNGINGGGWTSEKPAAVNGTKAQGYGLNWIAAFGKAHDKQVSVPEWGLDATSNDDGGGDDAYFVTQMAKWIKANATGPAIFWNYGGGTLPLNIPGYTSGNTPQATAAFKSAFSVAG